MPTGHRERRRHAHPASRCNWDRSKRLTPGRWSPRSSAMRCRTELVERIVERSDGNCLFIEELLRTWVSVGTLVPTERPAVGGWQCRRTKIPLPQSVQQIYAAQLDDLPPDARRLARRASVAGRRFAVRALEPLGAARDGLEPLRRRELVNGPLNDPLLGDAFAYRHALLRDAGYASSPAPNAPASTCVSRDGSSRRRANAARRSPTRSRRTTARRWRQRPGPGNDDRRGPGPQRS